MDDGMNGFDNSSTSYSLLVENYNYDFSFLRAMELSLEVLSAYSQNGATCSCCLHHRYRVVCTFELISMWLFQPVQFLSIARTRRTLPAVKAKRGQHVFCRNGGENATSRRQI